MADSVALTTDRTCDANVSCVGLYVGSTGNACGILGLLARACDGWGGLATFCAGQRQSSMALPADPVISEVAANQTVPMFLAHRGNLSQLSMLVKFLFQRMADMGLEPRLVETA